MQCLCGNGVSWTGENRERSRNRVGYFLKQLNLAKRVERDGRLCVLVGWGQEESRKFFGKFCLCQTDEWRASKVEEWVRSFSPDHSRSYSRRLERPAVKRSTLWFTHWTRELNAQAQLPNGAQGLVWLSESRLFLIAKCCRKCFSRPDLPAPQFWIEFKAYSAKF